MSSRSEKWSSDPNEVFEKKVKLYGCPEVCIAVVREHGLTARLERPDAQADFVVLVVSATRAQFRAARIEWLRRMMVAMPEAQVLDSQEVDLL